MEHTAQIFSIHAFTFKYEGIYLAFYTPLTEHDISALIKKYYLGDLESFQGVAGGVENSNYFVNTSQGQYVLTLFEEFEPDEVPYFLNVVEHFKQHGFNVPAALIDQNNERLHNIKNKPAILVKRFSGHEIAQTTVDYCALMGEQLALLHLAGQKFPEKRDSHRGVKWWRATSQLLAEKLSDEDASLLLKEVASFDELLRHEVSLPMGTVHGDLFYNNTLFEGNNLSAIIDFYNACYSWLSYDLAIAINDWCSDSDTGALQQDKYQAFMSAYTIKRPFTTDEKAVWPTMLSVAAMRFWLSRLEAWHGAIEDPDRLALQHDPDVFKSILLSRHTEKAQGLLSF